MDSRRLTSIREIAHFWPLLCVLCLTFSPAQAQTAEQLSQVKKLDVGSFGAGKGAAQMRSQVIRRLHERGVQVVSDPGQADAVMTGDGRLWVTGYVSLSPHSTSAREPVYQGFLSVKVSGKNSETLWSYLVTPGKTGWAVVTDDLAKQITAKLLLALKERNSEPPQSVNAAQGAQGRLNGAGATFPAPLYQQWFELFQERHAGVQISYEPVGSGEGIQRLLRGQVDFGASEMPLSEGMAQEYKDVVQLPAVLGAVVPIYNVEGLHESLKFMPGTLSGIYQGKITKWNDPQIKMSNRGVALPDAQIMVVHRSDASGTTFVWTDFLSKISPDWKTAVGSGTTLTWPVGTGAVGNDGVAAAVRAAPNSIGYVELIYAIQHELSFGAVQNVGGEFIRADIASVSAAASAPDAAGADLRASITNSPISDAYPVSSYTWLLLPKHLQDQNKRMLLVELLRWMLTSGQKTCSALGYVPLPPLVAKRALEAVDEIQ